MTMASNLSAATSETDARVAAGHVCERKPGIGVLAGIVAGNAFEFYDFVVYAFFAVYIGKAFFPSSTEYGSLLLSVAVFGVGFVFRPLGSILIGAYADRAGRKPAMMLTITLMTIGTLGLAATPSFEAIGLAAPIMVVVCRLTQGLALGGEVGPSSAYLVEIASPRRRGLLGSWQIASQGLAMLVAGLFGVAVVKSLSPAEVQSWGWRIPFAFGALLLPVAMYLRSSMPETRAKVAVGSRPPVRLGPHRRTIVLATLVILGGTVATYVGSFMTTYAITALKLPPVTAMLATVAIGAATVVFALLGGWLSDRVGRRAIMLWPRVAAALLTVPSFMMLIANPNASTLFIVTGVLGGLTAMSSAATIVAIMELLPRAVRSTGLSVAYAVGVSLFGGTTQFVVTWLMSATGSASAPAWYVAVTSLITAGAVLALPETLGRDDDGEEVVRLFT